MNCHRCQQPLDATASGTLCPACLAQLARAPWLNLESGFLRDDVDPPPSADTPPSLPAQPPPTPSPRRFGDYELLDEIARGGMGVVYRARQVSLDRIVALKMIRAGVLASELDIARFRAEARAAASLRHPHIIAIHEVGEHDDRHYFSMDFVAGRNLAESVRDHPWPAARAARCLQSVARAVDFAHQQGILHRDLKPSNIIIDDQGDPHLTDFGLATQIEGASALTLSGVILGTPSYMAPEQTGGRRAEIGPRTDLYALGAILYEVLTGRPPFQGETPLDTIKLVRETDAVPLRRLNPRLPVDLETICLKCLEKEPDRRYASASELADDLERFLKKEPIRARPVTALEHGLKWVRRNPWRAALAGAATVILVGGLGFLLEIEKNRELGGLNRQLHDLNRELAAEKEQVDSLNASLQDALAAERKAYEGEAHQRRLAEEARDEARLLDYVNRISMAHDAWEANNLALAESLLLNCPKDHRQWEWHYLWGLCRPDLGVVTRFVKVTNQVAIAVFSPDQTRLAVADARRNLEIVNLTDGSAMASSVPIGGVLTALAFASDHPWIALGSSGYGNPSITLLHTETIDVALSIQGITNAPRSLSFADNDRLLLTTDRYGVSARDTSDGALHWKIPVRDGHEALEVCSRSDHPWFLWTSGPKHTYDDGSNDQAPLADSIHIGDVETGRERRLIPVDRQLIRSVAFNPHASVIATGHTDGVIRLWDPRSGALMRLFRHGFGTILSVAMSADGNVILCSGADGTVGIHRSSVIEGDWTLEVYRGHRGAVLSSLIESDSSTAISIGTDGTVRRWNTGEPQDGLKIVAKTKTLAFVGEDTIFGSDGSFYSASNGDRLNLPDSSPHGPAAGDWRVSATRDSSWVASGRQLAKLSVNSDEPMDWIHISLPDRHSATGTAFSHSGKNLAHVGGRLGVRADYPLCEILDVDSWEPSGLSANDFSDLDSLINKLKYKPRSFDHWLEEQLTPGTRAALAGYLGPQSDREPLRETLLPNLDALLAGSSIYEEQRFEGIRLRSDTRALLSQEPEGADLHRLNRLLLEDAYPWEVARNRSWKVAARIPISSTNRFSYDVKFTPDDAQVAIATGSYGGANPGRVELWEWQIPRLVRAFPASRFCVWTVGISPDGRRIASGGGYYYPWGNASSRPTRPYGEIHVWDLASGAPLFSLPGVDESAMAIEFSPDNQRLVAAMGPFRTSSDGDRQPGVIRVWEMLRGLPVLTLKGFPGPVTGVAFSPSGRRLAAIGSGVIRVFDAPTYGQPEAPEATPSPTNAPSRPLPSVPFAP